MPPTYGQVRYLADLIRRDYYGTPPEWMRRWEVGSMAVLHGWHNGQLTVLVRGSDDFEDWLLNFTIGADELAAGASGALYYRGFIGDAKLLYAKVEEWLDPEHSTDLVLTGHSRGAAIASIVGSSRPSATIVFGCPRVVRRKDGARLPHEDTVFVYNRADDRIGSLPPAITGFDHLGTVTVLRPTRRHVGEDHRIQHYIDLMEETPWQS